MVEGRIWQPSHPTSLASVPRSFCFFPLHNGAVPVLGGDHDGDGAHAAEVGAGHLAGDGWGQGCVAGGPLILLHGGDFVVLGLEGILVQVGGGHGAQGGTLAAHAGERASRRHAALWRGNVLSERGGKRARWACKQQETSFSTPLSHSLEISPRCPARQSQREINNEI